MSAQPSSNTAAPPAKSAFDRNFNPLNRSIIMADLQPNTDCYVIGDSIAVGSAQAVRECRVDAKIGISSTAIASRAHNAKLVVISAGSDDSKNPRLKQDLELIRSKTKGRVLWIVPVDKTAADAVRAVAARHRDGAITFSAAKDNVHPRSYFPIAAQIRAELKSLKTATSSPAA
jgi:hypothetical protein